jgi:hypothetical protein
MTRLALQEDFGQGLSNRWRRIACHGANLQLTGDSLRLVNAGASAQRYSNAQIDDYGGLPRRRFLWSPPLTLTIRARFSHPGPRLSSACDCDFHYQPSSTDSILGGTAGFGFWNDPAMTTGRRIPALPRAIWFFYASPPSNMKLDLATPGCGWKAATFDAARLPFLALAPTIPVAVPLMNLPAAYRRLWPIGQRAISVSEAPVDTDMTEWHTYRIDWGAATARFWVDDQLVLDCDTPPRGPLGLVIWLDNQFMVVTPQGRLRHGLLAKPGEQWLEIGSVVIESSMVTPLPAGEPLPSLLLDPASNHGPFGDA